MAVFMLWLFFFFFHKQRWVIKCNKFDTVSGKQVQCLRTGQVWVPPIKTQLSSLCLLWSWPRSLAIVQRQDVLIGQVGALLKGDRAKMLSMCPGFQKFEVLLSSVL